MKILKIVGFIAFVVVALFVSFELRKLERKNTYEKYYKDMIQKTIKNMVREECLKTSI